MNEKLIININQNNKNIRVGLIEIYTQRGSEHYNFTYDKNWLTNGFSLGSDLPLQFETQYSHKLWGAFQDISPDRWGKTIQDRIAENNYLSDSDYMLGVSDYMRLGALRISNATSPDIFLAEHNDVPKLTRINALERAIKQIERGLEEQEDLNILLGAGTSIGGAHPKAIIEDQGLLYLAKFQSKYDNNRISLWEATMLSLAQKAGIPTSSFKTINKDGSQPVLLVQRFDRNAITGARIHFASSMNLANSIEGNEYSYAELGDIITQYSSTPQKDRLDLFKRMVFNAMTGNTDDHLRNHGFLRHTNGWTLSPAYDLNPNNLPYEKRTHALAFMPGEYKPSLKILQEVGDILGIKKAQQLGIFADVGIALVDWKKIAKHNGLTDNEINKFSPAFEHEDSKKLLHLSLNTTQAKTKIDGDSLDWDNGPSM